ncbi:hypothetical protein [Streptomyces sp. ISL-1]|uniref:hypothetical protein n=1 Tax=Streptomyces sp. ISL-1 TaxID=2817657 RepID=UPI001BEA0BBA|nr:hypothetical protein [Streptomyces sp. ISL-1]
MRATAAGVFADHGGPVRALHTDGQEPALLDYLFRDGLPLPHWGLCFSGRPEKDGHAVGLFHLRQHFVQVHWPPPLGDRTTSLLIVGDRGSQISDSA